MYGEKYQNVWNDSFHFVCGQLFLIWFKEKFLQGFLGDKYGSRLIPSKIDASEFKMLRRIAMKLGHDVTNLDQWYHKDENAEPPEYYLVPINKILKHYTDDKEECAEKKKKVQLCIANHSNKDYYNIFYILSKNAHNDIHPLYIEIVLSREPNKEKCQ